MEKKFPSVYNLVDEDAAARKYYNSLSPQIRAGIENKAKSISSYDDLKNAAEILMKKS
ncbi:MAG: hypothetical protein VB018_00520 [Lachnospiraceae bacterium]|nr:hypothetical protein [Lachnospiraceae bacterium]